MSENQQPQPQQQSAELNLPLAPDTVLSTAFTGEGGTRVPEEWAVLAPQELERSVYDSFYLYLRDELQVGRTIDLPEEQIFNSLNYTVLETVHHFKGDHAIKAEELTVPWVAEKSDDDEWLILVMFATPVEGSGALQEALPFRLKMVMPESLEKLDFSFTSRVVSLLELAEAKF